MLRANLGRRFSAAVVRVEHGGRVAFERAYGNATNLPDARAIHVDTRFDIASITKVFVATVALALVAEGRLELDRPLVEFVPEWRGARHEPIALRMILAHEAGFKSGADYRTLLDRDVEAFALGEPLVAAPGERVVYSDLGFIALGSILARVTGRSLRATVEDRLTALGSANVRFVPRGAERAAIPATERDAWRGLVQGTVHDEKAALLNGVAGHAGLFADAADVARLAEWFLAPLRGRATPLDPAVARAAVHEAAFEPVLRRGLGWALKTSDENSCGARMSSSTFGHTGFTGTCVWADPERDVTIVLLTNAVHFGRSDIRAIRAAVCDAAIAEIAS
ncbi:MAG: serine hydrolase domain-containing protein [Candidatus Velthaea sp.]